MATFKVGQRVRIIGADPGNTVNPVGHEAVIVAPYDGMRHSFDWYVESPTLSPGLHPIGAARGWWAFPSEHLAPLSDPGADAFIERIKKLKPYDEPKADVKRRFIDKIESVVGPLGPRFK